MQGLFEILRGYPSLGDFLAFQFTIDLNYSELTDFSEMDFVVAGPGARNGIEKCFKDTAGLTEAEVIAHMARIADEEFDRLGLHFTKLGGKRPLQLIDCQNVFCETDKYARVAHPEFSGASGRTRIKQRFNANTAPLPQFSPPKWGINAAQVRRASSSRHDRSAQTHLEFAQAADVRRRQTSPIGLGGCHPVGRVASEYGHSASAGWPMSSSANIAAEGGTPSLILTPATTVA